MTSRTIFYILLTVCFTTLYGFDNFHHVRESPTKMALIGYKEYIRKVAQEFLFELDNYSLSKFKISDFNQTVSKHFFGLNVEGNIDYQNGFIGFINNATIKDYSEQSSIDADASETSVYATVQYFDILYYYDYHANLTAGKIDGTVEILSRQLDHKLTVTKTYPDNKIKGKLKYLGESMNPFDRWDFFPINKYVEVIRREAQHYFNPDWQKLFNTTMNELLENVIRRIPYPELCYDCADH